MTATPSSTATAPTSSTETTSSSASRTIDHRHTKLSSIPESAINKAKVSLHIAYGHTSHGSQIVNGMRGLTYWKGSLYKVPLPKWRNTVEGEPLDLRPGVFEGAKDLGNPDRTTWAAATCAYLKENPEINVVMWSWCAQAGYATEDEIETYLSLMSELERDYPKVAFVYMTGHLDGSGLTGTLHLRNEQIRAHCRENNCWLYDFADIESYDPDGVYYGDKNADDGCYYDSDGDGKQDRNWAIDWMASHTMNKDWYRCGAAHSEAINSNLKAYAAWHLFARIAGWND